MFIHNSTCFLKILASTGDSDSVSFFIFKIRSCGSSQSITCWSSGTPQCGSRRDVGFSSGCRRAVGKISISWHSEVQWSVWSPGGTQMEWRETGSAGGRWHSRQAPPLTEDSAVFSPELVLTDGRSGRIWNCITFHSFSDVFVKIASILSKSFYSCCPFRTRNNFCKYPDGLRVLSLYERSHLIFLLKSLNSDETFTSELFLNSKCFQKQFQTWQFES